MLVSRPLMCQITLEVPDASLQTLHLTPETAGRELALLSAIKLFELGRLSSGAAAHLAGISKPEFLDLLPKLGIAAVNVTAEYLEGEARLG